MDRSQFFAWLATIPSDEPIFVLRAKDDACLHALVEYRKTCVEIGSPKDHLIGVHDIEEEFRNWRDLNRDKCKVPD